MDEHIENELHRAVGLSDLAALLAAGLSFPAADLSEALASGAFLADWRASALDACDEVTPVQEELLAKCAQVFSAEGGGDADAAADVLRREYSRLFLTPGANVPIWPYESAFRHRAVGASGAPALFRSRCALDVEQSMHDAGVATVDEHREPGDSIFRELEFLSYLHACRGEALRQVGEARECDGHEDVAKRSAQLIGFAREHALVWMPAFMEQVGNLTRVKAYARLADLGLWYLAELEAEADRLASSAIENDR